MDTIDFVCGYSLEQGDKFEWNGEILEIRQIVEDSQTVIVLLCESLDTGDDDVKVSLSPDQVVPLKGYYYEESV